MKLFMLFMLCCIAALSAGVPHRHDVEEDVFADEPENDKEEFEQDEDEEDEPKKYIMEKILEANGVYDEANDPSTGKAKRPELFEGDIIKTPQLMEEITDVVKLPEEKPDKNKTPDIFETILEANKFDKKPVKKDEPNEEEDAIAYANQHWKGAVVPYTYARGVSSNMVRAVNQAIADYAKYTCIRFVRRSSQKNYIEFFRGQGCYSYIGMQGGKQKVSLGQGCQSKGVAIHEMMHALGFFHEQSRFDRDEHIKILFYNIKPAFRSNFEKYKEGQATTMQFPYDEKSIMHYPPKAFSRNGGDTIRQLNGHKSHGQIGQRKGLSRIDKQQLKALYCTGKLAKGVKKAAKPIQQGKVCKNGVCKETKCRRVGNRRICQIRTTWTG